jgi:hypothetical protein
MDMNILHLIWICPLFFWFGFALSAILSMAQDTRDDPVREIHNVRSGRAGE